MKSNQLKKLNVCIDEASELSDSQIEKLEKMEVATDIFMGRISEYYDTRNIKTPEHIYEAFNALMDNYEKQLKELENE